MAVGTEISRVRRLAASASLVTAGLGWLAAFHRGGAVVAAFAGLIALAGVGIGRRSVLAQVLSRGVAWLVFVAGVVATIADRHLSPAALAVVAGTGAALVLCRPLLHTESARDEFGPMRFRGSFLASATSAVAFATVAGAGALETLARGNVTASLGWLAMAAGLLGAAVGVVRMRAWGVLLGVLTTTTMVLVAALTPGWRDLLLVLAAPGALLALPVLLARLGVGEGDPRGDPPAVRVAAFTPPALRIGAAPAGPVEDADEVTETVDESERVERRAGVVTAR